MTGNHANDLSLRNTAHERLAISHEVRMRPMGTSIDDRRPGLRARAGGGAVRVRSLGSVSGATAVAVPGRVNLMGDHTDYNRGLVLPMAIDRWCRVTASPNGEPVVRARSAQLDGTVDVRLDRPITASTVEPAWGRFVAGAVDALRAAGAALRGVDLAISSSVPPGSGLSSSSALAVALTLALAPDLDTDVVRRAELALDAEVRATGVPGGLMDQLAALACRAGHVLAIDFDTLTMDHVPLPPGIGVLVVHCGTRRTLVDSEYSARRAECDAIAARLGLRSLRDATARQVADLPRARHVVSENERVLATVDALRAGDVGRVGTLMLDSHASLRDDYQVSTRELDAAVDALVGAGAAGARLTGAGFGGCVVAVCATDRAETVLAGGIAAYRASTGIEASGFVVHAVDGALG
jgi:galactokinase